MTVTITFTAGTLHECLALVLGASAQAQAEAEQQQPAEETGRSQFYREEAAELELAPIEPVQPESPSPPPPPPPSADSEALRTEIRSVLTPVMRGPRGAEAKALVLSFGDGISKVSDDKLPELLAKAKELAA